MHLLVSEQYIDSIIHGATINSCKYYNIIPGDSLARGPKLLSIKNYVMFVSQLTDDELTTGYYQQDGVTLQMAACEEFNVFF